MDVLTEKIAQVVTEKITQVVKNHMNPPWTRSTDDYIMFIVRQIKSRRKIRHFVPLTIRSVVMLDKSFDAWEWRVFARRKPLFSTIQLDECGILWWEIVLQTHLRKPSFLNFLWLI
jgi:hypothetical protein